ncbi:MAG: hypothetical protein HON51_02125 [Gammaproteobacteria bacterium]|jgi:hypothetical protein|nr:hypothetical protein [Gammaproteobacteria bacterium]MBT5223081.1 hypothetical protein [Gammaproteobacteria bacterium]MBT5826258.1 hypothetical protein [Gammaproteobacteria bacterium]MBT5967408.1 hypothetical protein [Gammaproteobacteria bacterium]MBT6420539.1 hypothetical protein [Gammaproteobacteria bacterium]
MKNFSLTFKVPQHYNTVIHSIKPQHNTASRYKNDLGFCSGIPSLITDKSHALLSIIFLALILPLTAHAHRGAKGEVDTCRISVGKEVIHFSAYTPTLSGGKSFCQIIPEIGPTNLVIDYEGKNLRHTTVEFEVTKEPAGTRVYHHSPEQITKGTIDAKVDFTQYGAGDYLLHVTVLNQGETIDSHLPFSVGIEQAESAIPNKILVPIIIIFIIFSVMFYISKTNKKEPPSANGSEE